MTTRLENTGSKVLHWITDGCQIHVGLGAQLAMEWSYGMEQPAPFKRFKDWTLERYDADDRYPIRLDTVPDWGVDEGQFGCADLGMGHDLKPGRKLTARMLVRVNMWPDHWYGRPPAGPVLLTGSFGTWWRGDEDMDSVQHESLVANLVVDLMDGRDPALISAGQAVDVALSDTQLQAQLLEWPDVPNFVPTTIVLDETREEWIFGAGFERASNVRPITIRIDAREARIVAVANEPAPTREPPRD
ncbi:MAG TPA: hypothetical protein VFP56_04805 [Candidatus Limnocylindrales bacterium]|nr:hypothetical protein [Candidatus Limnocylindrales bacterium]